MRHLEAGKNAPEYHKCYQLVNFFKVKRIAESSSHKHLSRTLLRDDLNSGINSMFASIWPLSKFYVGYGNLQPVYPKASVKIAKRETWRIYQRISAIISRLSIFWSCRWSSLICERGPSFDKSNENLFPLWSWAFQKLQSHYFVYDIKIIIWHWNCFWTSKIFQ